MGLDQRSPRVVKAHVARDTRSAALPQEDRDRRSILLGVRLVAMAVALGDLFARIAG